VSQLFEDTDANRSALCEKIKASLRNAQCTLTWEQRVAAIARMNKANKIAKKVGWVEARYPASVSSNQHDAGFVNPAYSAIP
jgi:hypothetical protein